MNNINLMHTIERDPSYLKPAQEPLRIYTGARRIAMVITLAGMLTAAASPVLAGDKLGPITNPVSNPGISRFFGNSEPSAQAVPRSPFLRNFHQTPSLDNHPPFAKSIPLPSEKLKWENSEVVTKQNLPTVDAYGRAYKKFGNNNLTVFDLAQEAVNRGALTEFELRKMKMYNQPQEFLNNSSFKYFINQSGRYLGLSHHEIDLILLGDVTEPF